MKLQPLPVPSQLGDYQRQAEELLDAWRAGDAGAIDIFGNNHPRFLDTEVRWLRKASDEEVRAAPLEIADGRRALAGWYSFADWEHLAEWVELLSREGSPEQRFELAVEAVIGGDEEGLRRFLRDDPGLARARSSIVTGHDPPQHRATLLHYIAANGVEGFRQKTPKNAVEIARILLDAGAEPDALAGMYGGEATTMSMLVSSSHPQNAGVEIPLVHLLVDHGASVESRGRGDWTSPLLTAIVFSHQEAAEALVQRGARLDIRDKLWEGTPLGWAIYCEKPAAAEYLRSKDAPR